MADSDDESLYVASNVNGQTKYESGRDRDNIAQISRNWQKDYSELFGGTFEPTTSPHTGDKNVLVAHSLNQVLGTTLTSFSKREGCELVIVGAGLEDTSLCRVALQFDKAHVPLQHKNKKLLILGIIAMVILYFAYGAFKAEGGLSLDRESEVARRYAPEVRDVVNTAHEKVLNVHNTIKHVTGTDKTVEEAKSAEEIAREMQRAEDERAAAAAQRKLAEKKKRDAEAEAARAEAGDAAFADDSGSDDDFFKDEF